MSDTTPRLQLPLIGDHSQNRIVMNAGLMRLESLVQAQAISRTLSAQPLSPNDGDTYILLAIRTDAVWGQLAAGTFVRAEGGAWEVVASVLAVKGAAALLSGKTVAGGAAATF